MAFLIHLLRSDDLFVDAGANIGSYTVLAYAVCRALTIAIEPDPGTVQSLKRNVEANHITARVALHQVALGSESGQIQFTVGQDSTNRVATQSDLSTRTVELRSLDDLLGGASPVLIKMDVEGYEAQVIAGAVETLKNKSLLAVQLECVDENVRVCLENFGFKPASYNPFTRRVSIGNDPTSAVSSLNTLFIRDVNTCRKRVETAPIRQVIGHGI